MNKRTSYKQVQVMTLWLQLHAKVTATLRFVPTLIHMLRSCSVSSKKIN